METHQDCNCVIWEEWAGQEPEWQLADDTEQQTYYDLPDPFDEVLGG